MGVSTKKCATPISVNIRIASRVRGTEEEAKATVVEAEVRVEPEAIGEPTVARTAIVATATQDTFKTTVRTDRVGDGRGRIVAVPIGTPLPDVARHVVETELIGGVLGDRMGLIVAIAIVPSDIVDVVRTGILVAFGEVTTTGSKFPFSLCREGERAIGDDRVELLDERLTVVPRDLLDRAGGVSHEIRGVATHDSHVEGLRDGSLGEVVVSLSFPMNFTYNSQIA